MFSNTKATLVAPVGRGNDIGFSRLGTLIGDRVTSNVSTLIVYNAANRGSALGCSRRLGMVRATILTTGGGMPMITNAKDGSALCAISLYGSTRDLNTSTFLVMAPCCGGTSRSKLITRCGCVTSHMRGPVVLCGIPSHANISVGPRACGRLDHRGGVITAGRTSKSLGGILRAHCLYNSSLRVCSNGSSRVIPVVSLNNLNMVSIVSGVLPGRARGLYGTCLSNRVSGTRGLRVGCTKLVGTLFYSIGPTPIGTTVGLVNVRTKPYELPLCPLGRGGLSFLGRGLVRYSLLGWW